MPHIEYCDLSEEVQLIIAQLQNDVDDLKFEAQFYRFATAVAIIIAVERLWDRLF